jgi:hypothetical protein
MMHLKIWARGTLVLLAAILLGCAAPQPYLADPREDLKGLKSKVYSVELNNTDVLAIKKVFLEGILSEIGAPPTDEKYGDAKMLDQSDTSFRLRAVRKHVVWAMPPPDLEVRFFIETIPDRPALRRANAYLVAIQNPGPGEARYSLQGVGMMDESVADRFVRDFFPKAKQQLDTK